MDIPRYALIAASMLLGLMLLGEWTRFTANEQAAIAASPIVESLPQNQSTALADTDPGVLDQSYENDMPSAGDLAQAQSTRIDGLAQTASGSLITVQTDVLDIVIDQIGRAHV